MLFTPQNYLVLPIKKISLETGYLYSRNPHGDPRKKWEEIESERGEREREIEGKRERGRERKVLLLFAK